MKDSKYKQKESEEKFEKYKKEIQNEKLFGFRINSLFSIEFEDQLKDILILDQTQFYSQIKNRVKAELEQIYSSKIFSDHKFSSLFEKGINSIKSDYNENFRTLNNIYEAYLKNRNSKNDKVKFLTSGYRRHCINEVYNDFAFHNCSAKLGKFILVEKNDKIDFVICSNCKKVYYDTMILCKCYKCNVEYYTEIFQNNEDEYILPATWDNYHCKQITKEKMKCTKCRDILYINIKTNTLLCLNKRCNFSSKPNKILWNCSICKQNFNSGAQPYNPLDLELIQNVIKQTLSLKQLAHPKKIPCCKFNLYSSVFYHNNKCDGVLYSGKLNREQIIVCEKCNDINYYERFIWTCPQCKNKFTDDNENINLLNDKLKMESYKDSSNNSKNRKHRESYHSNKLKEITAFNIDKNNKDIDQDNDIDDDDITIKRNKSMKFKKKLNNIYYERNKEKKEINGKEIILSNYLSEKDIKKKDDNKLQDLNHKRKRSRIYSNFVLNNNDISEEKEENNDKRKIENTSMNVFAKFRKNRKPTETEKEQEKKEIKEKESKIRVDKIKENDIKNSYQKIPEIAPYKSCKRKTNHNISLESNALKKLINEKKDEEKENIPEIPEVRRERKRFFSHYEKGIDKDKNKNKELDISKNKNNSIKEKIKEEDEKGKEKEKEKEDINTTKRSNRIHIESKQEIKKEEPNFKNPEPRKTLVREKKEEVSSISNSKIFVNNKTKEVNLYEEKKDSESPEKSENKKKDVKMSKIPGMSESLYNHVMKRITNITSKCSIPMMNIEDYTQEKKIGEGCYGIIYKVVDKKDKKEFALKKIVSNKLQKISECIKEFELIYSCHHENIMKIYSYCIRILDASTYALFVLMELSEGDWDTEIKTRFMKKQNYTEKELVNILYQLSSSLLYSEQNLHISHRDIKPQNVLVFPGGKYKMADFGEAKETKIMKQRNTLRGTELFMSPVLYNGLKHDMNDVSHNPFKSDVFSLGFCFIYASALNFNVLYQVRGIFDNKNINMILHQFLGKFYSEKFISLIASMLEMDESKRYDFSDINKYIEKNFGDMIK